MNQQEDTPVQPVKDLAAAGPTEIPHGLTKREWFAGMAMQGLLACPHGEGMWLSAKYAVNAADELIAELEKPKDKTSAPPSSGESMAVGVGGLGHRYR